MRFGDPSQALICRVGEFTVRVSHFPTIQFVVGTTSGESAINQRHVLCYHCKTVISKTLSDYILSQIYFTAYERFQKNTLFTNNG